MDKEHLRIRLGDMGDYETFGHDLDAAGLALREGGVRLPLEWFVSGVGFQCGGYEGHDYVSCFWGDEDGNLTRALNEQEQEELAAAIEGTGGG